LSEKINKKKEQPLSKKQRYQILLAVALGTFMGPLDGSVVNLALPSISNHFNVSLSAVEWVVISYLLVISSLLLTYGRMGDLYGHKRIYISGFIVFTTGSLLCGISSSIIMLIIFRAVQALGAGMLMAIGPAIVTDIAPPKERGKFLGIIAVAVSVALATGPVIGGILTDKFGWQSVFLMNIPIGIIGIIWAIKVIPGITAKEKIPFDIKGAVLMFLALITILFPLSYAEYLSWSHPLIIGLLFIGIIFFAVFFIIEKKEKYPMMDLSLFKNRLFFLGNIASLLNFMSQFSTVFLMPFYLQQLRGISPSQAGLIMLPMPLVTMIIAPLSGSLSDRFDSRYLRTAGMSITTIGLLLLSSLKYNTPIINVIGSLTVIGLGVGIFQTPNNSMIMGNVPPNRRGIASSLLATMRNVGMVLGVAVSGAIFTNYRQYLMESLQLQGLSGAILKIESFTGGLHLTYLIGAALAFIAVIVSFKAVSSNFKVKKQL
jgi:EmrB/QacA subfamily drug resistance transporter